MRQQPEEAQEFIGNNVFTTSAWGAPGSQYDPQPNLDNVIDLSKYAATSIPQGYHSNNHVVNDSYSQTSTRKNISHKTNSQGNPFAHASYDNEPQDNADNAYPQYEDMPSTLRKSHLGVTKHDTFIPQAHASSTISSYPQTTVPQPTTPQSTVPRPSAPTAPLTNYKNPYQSFRTNNNQDTTNESPIINPDKNAIPTPVIESPQAYEPLAQGDTNGTNSATVIEDSNVSEEVDTQNQIVLSDFEQEYLTSHQSNEETQSSVSVVDSTATAPAWNPPALFSSNSVSTPTYQAEYDIFAQRPLNTSDEELLYADEKPHRETIRLDMDFVKRIFGKLTLNKITIVLIAIILIATAYFIMRPNTHPSTPKNTQEEQIISNSGGKTIGSQDPQNIVQTPADANESVNKPSVDSSKDTAPSVEYDANGNVVYTPTNQNFNGL